MLTFNITLNQRELNGMLNYVMKDLTKEEKELARKIYDKFLDKFAEDIELLRVTKEDLEPFPDIGVQGTEDPEDESS